MKEICINFSNHMKMGIFDSRHQAHQDWRVGYVEMIPIEVRIELDASTVAIASLKMSLTTTMHGRWSWATQSPSHEQDDCRQLTLNDISRFKRCVLYSHDDLMDETTTAIRSMSGVDASAPNINIRLDLDIKYVRQFPKITKLGRFNPPTRTKNIDLKTASPAARIALTAGTASALHNRSRCVIIESMSKVNTNLSKMQFLY